MMPFAQLLWRVLGLATLSFTLCACSWNLEDMVPDRRPDYRESKLTNRLEVPPDLTASTIDDTLAVPELNPTGSASLSTYASERTGAGQVKNSEAVLATPANMHIEREGARRWLLVDNQSPEQLWPKLKEFWTTNGLTLSRDDPRIGVMETGWAENRADVSGGVIRDVLKKFIDFAYSAPTRDRFRLRVERMEGGTAIFLTHYGLQEATVGDERGRKDVTTTTVWQPRPADPELEAEMLNRLMVYLGASEQRAATQVAKGGAPSAAPRARLTTAEGQQAVVIDDNYARAWRWVGLALDGSNFAVEDQNRAQGRYTVEYRDLTESSSEPGFLSRMAFWKDKPPPKGTRYQVLLSGQGNQTVVVVHNAEGQPDDSPVARQILQTLVDTIK